MNSYEFSHVLIIEVPHRLLEQTRPLPSEQTRPLPSEQTPPLSSEQMPPLPSGETTRSSQKSLSHPSNGRQAKTLSLSTVKYHFLGDYVQHIHLWGTTDSYSTQLVSSVLFRKHNALTY